MLCHGLGSLGVSWCDLEGTPGRRAVVDAICLTRSSCVILAFLHVCVMPGPRRGTRAVPGVPVLLDHQCAVGGVGAVVAPTGQHPRQGAAVQRNTHVGWFWTGSSTWSGAVSPGRSCLGSSRRTRPSTAPTAAGPATVRGSRSTTRYVIWSGSPRAATRCPAPRSSTPRRYAVPTPCPPSVPAMTPARKRSQATHRRGHSRAPARRRRHRRPHPRPRRRPSSAGGAARPLLHRFPHLGRRGLRRTPGDLGAQGPVVHRRDRQTHR